MARLLSSVCLLQVLSLLTQGRRCCAAETQCNSVIRLKNAVIRRQQQQQSTDLSTANCAYTIEAIDPSICQLRVDFERFELAAPSYRVSESPSEVELEQAGCNTEYLRIGRFTLCGRNTGQHLYLPLRPGANQLLTFMLRNGAQANYQLKLSQLACPSRATQSDGSDASAGSSGNKFWRPTGGMLFPFFKPRESRTFWPLRHRPRPTTTTTTHAQPSSTSNEDFIKLAPLGCDQYYAEQQGTIRSFNYVDGVGRSVYLPNMNYAICIYDAKPGTTIVYNFQRFSMSDASSTLGAGYDSDCHAIVQTPGRAEDHLLIPHSSFVSDPTRQPTYYCGKSLNARSIIARAPFIIYFASDESSGDVETGFSLNYKVQ